MNQQAHTTISLRGINTEPIVTEMTPGNVFTEMGISTEEKKAPVEKELLDYKNIKKHVCNMSTKNNKHRPANDASNCVVTNLRVENKCIRSVNFKFSTFRDCFLDNVTFDDCDLTGVIIDGQFNKVNFKNCIFSIKESRDKDQETANNASCYKISYHYIYKTGKRTTLIEYDD
jgi:hypothetical protein